MAVPPTAWRCRQIRDERAKTFDQPRHFLDPPLAARTRATGGVAASTRRSAAVEHCATALAGFACRKRTCGFYDVNGVIGDRSHHPTRLRCPGAGWLAGRSTWKRHGRLPAA